MAQPVNCLELQEIRMDQELALSACRPSLAGTEHSSDWRRELCSPSAPRGQVVKEAEPAAEPAMLMLVSC